MGGSRGSKRVWLRLLGVSWLAHCFSLLSVPFAALLRPLTRMLNETLPLHSSVEAPEDRLRCSVAHKRLLVTDQRTPRTGSSIRIRDSGFAYAREIRRARRAGHACEFRASVVGIWVGERRKIPHKW